MMTDAANATLRKSTRAKKATTLQVTPIVQTASKRKDSVNHTTNKRARSNSKAKQPTQEAKGSNQEPKTLLQGSGSAQASSTNTDNADQSADGNTTTTNQPEEAIDSAEGRATAEKDKQASASEHASTSEEATRATTSEQLAASTAAQPAHSQAPEGVGRSPQAHSSTLEEQEDVEMTPEEQQEANSQLDGQSGIDSPLQSQQATNTPADQQVVDAQSSQGEDDIDMELDAELEQAGREAQEMRRQLEIEEIYHEQQEVQRRLAIVQEKMRQAQLQRKVEEPCRVHKQAHFYSSSEEEANSSVEDEDQGQASGSARQDATTEVERMVQSPGATWSSPPPEEPIHKHKGKAKAKTKGKAKAKSKGKGKSKYAHLLEPATDLDELIRAGKIIVNPASKDEDFNVEDETYIQYSGSRNCPPFVEIPEDVPYHEPEAEFTASKDSSKREDSASEASQEDQEEVQSSGEEEEAEGEQDNDDEDYQSSGGKVVASTSKAGLAPLPASSTPARKSTPHKLTAGHKGHAHIKCKDPVKVIAEKPAFFPLPRDARNNRRLESHFPKTTLTLEHGFVLQNPACEKCLLHGIVCTRGNGLNFAGKSRIEEGKKSKCDYCSFLGKPCSTGPRNSTAKDRALDKLLEVHAFLTDSATLARDDKKVQLEYTRMAASLFEAYDELSGIAKERGTSKPAPRKKKSAKK